MILKAPLSFINYIEQSKRFLNCPHNLFNEDLHATYRQFKAAGTAQLHIAEVLFTFGYSKSEAIATATKLVEFYTNTSIGRFNEMNVDTYKDGIPEHLLDLNDKISNYINRGTKHYPFTNIVSHRPSYEFKEGYKIKKLS